MVEENDNKNLTLNFIFDFKFFQNFPLNFLFYEIHIILNCIQGCFQSFYLSRKRENLTRNKNFPSLFTVSNIMNHT